MFELLGIVSWNEYTKTCNNVYLILKPVFTVSFFIDEIEIS